MHDTTQRVAALATIPTSIAPTVFPAVEPAGTARDRTGDR